MTCLEHATTYSDDRLAQASLLADLAIDPATDGPPPSLAMGGLNADVLGDSIDRNHAEVNENPRRTDLPDAA